jgi:hypothetical protein
MSDNSQLMEITARTVSIARATAVADERARILWGIKKMEAGNLPEVILLLHKIQMLVKDES